MTLREGRDRAAPIDSEACFLACCRSIGLNPMRARMVRHLRDCAWSSYDARGAIDPLLSGPALFDGLRTNPHDRQKAYRELFREEGDGFRRRAA